MYSSQEFQDNLRDISPYLPELPQQDAFEVLERAEEWERRILGLRSGDQPRLAHYRNGSAVSEDAITILQHEPVAPLVTAEHATDVVRKATGQLGNADHGTGALAALLWEDSHTTSIIPVGKQTGNAAVDLSHPVKDAVNTLLPARPAYLSVHGMRAGKITGVHDTSEVHAIVGLGKTPNEQSVVSAEKLQRVAKDIGLRVIIGNQESHYDVNPDTRSLEYDEEGNPKRAKLAALGQGSMTNHAYTLMGRHGIQIPAMQLEITRGLRLIPNDFESGWHKDRRARAMSVYAGYLLVRKMVETVQ